MVLLHCVISLMFFFFKDDYYTPVVKESDIDVETFSTAYKEKKKMREDSTVVKIGRMTCFLLNLEMFLDKTMSPLSIKVG